MATEPTPPPTDLELAQERVTAYRLAELRVLRKAQSFQVGDGSTARAAVYAELRDVQRGLADAKAEVAALQGQAGTGGRRVVYLRSGC